MATAEQLNKRFEHSRVTYISDLMHLAKRENNKKFTATAKLKKISKVERKSTTVLLNVVAFIYQTIRSIDSYILSLVLKYYNKRRLVQNNIIDKAANTSEEVQRYLSEL